MNCVRFSPNSKILATGSDDGFVILWKLEENPSTVMKPLETQNEDEPKNVRI